MGGFNASAFNPSREQAQSELIAQYPPAASLRQAQACADPSSSQRFRAFVAKLSSSARHVGEGLSQCFVADNQPQVKWWRDSQGHDHYSVYDPHRQQTYEFATAHEVRVWLEQRYYE